MADDERSLHAGGADRLGDVLGVVLRIVRRLVIALPVPAQVDGQHGMVDDQRLDHRAPGLPALGDAVDEDHGGGELVADELMGEQHARQATPPAAAAGVR